MWKLLQRECYFQRLNPLKNLSYFIRKEQKFDNPEVAFHDMRLHWKEDCYIELDFPNAYKSMVSFAVLENNPYFVSEVEDEEVVQDELATIQKEAMIAQLKLDINEALEAMDSERFMELTNRLKELEDE